MKVRICSTICCLGVLVTPVALFGYAQQPPKTPIEMVKEALSGKPIDKSATPQERQLIRASQDLFNDIRAVVTKHSAGIAKLAPTLDHLYTAESFSGKEQMQDMIAAINKMLELDSEMVGKLENVPGDMEKRLRSSTMDRQLKADFMAGIEEAYGGSELFRLQRQARDREEKWVSATIVLYNFVLQNAEKAHVKDKKLLFSGDALVAEFNLKYKNSRDLRQQFNETIARAEAARAANMQKLGITKSDLGPDKE